MSGSGRRHPARSLRALGLTLGYGGRRVVRDVELEVPPGRLTALIGPNGCGKSTLLASFARQLRPMAGELRLDGRGLASYGAREYARLVGILPQHPEAPEGITVAELVERGRSPHRGPFARPSRRDREAVAEALLATEAIELADRAVDSLSGGQRQRVWIAVLLAQDPELLLLDEPTTYLDPAHQLDVLELLRRWSRERGTTIVAVLHELALAARCADHLFAMREGRLVRGGTPAEVLTVQGIRDIFEMEAVVLDSPIDGSPLVVPRARARGADGAV